ncbi:hypothetical protein OGH69_08695 [Flavobacterium sp. MFBS3-15]|uniref:hypothetical protein n=1 Tax=Flavobacterium sp. MFBS3-15 TaxID=2989816 RepID=UPI0022356B9F|nr:hypothetical protein [Flavobacterium sp. MFBS3-15]MCW4469039.1 hypothetical protein [Flavobacterium sp. MFBS3-15]
MTFTSLYKLLNFLSPFILIMGLGIGLPYFKRLNNIHKGIIGYLLMMLLIDMASRFFQYNFGNNLIVLLVYSLVEMLFFVFFYYKFLFKASHILIKLFSIIAASYIIWELFYFSNNVRQFQSYAKVADNFVIITLALAFFSEKIHEYKESKLDSFYLNAVILIFFSINLIFFLPLNFILNERTGLYFWLVNLITTVSFYSYLIYSIIKNGKNFKKA